MYKINLTKEQKHMIYRISDNKEKQSKLMSVLQYCIKYTDKLNGVLNMTISKLFSMYSAKNFKYHDKISRKYFYTLVNSLVDKNLICVHKKVHKKVHENNMTESIENTLVEQVIEIPNNLTINNTYNYTLNTENNSVYAIDLCKDVFKDLKVKSKIIKDMVCCKLKNTILDINGAVAYIVAVITEKTEQYNLMRINYAKKVATTKYTKNKKAIGSPTRSFNNFECREYDYNKLEEWSLYGGYEGEYLPR